MIVNWIAIFVGILAVLAVRRYQNRTKHSSCHRSCAPRPEIGLAEWKALSIQHGVHSAFMTLIYDEGAGSWPPRATHNDFPEPLCPFKEIYAIMAPLLVTAEPLFDDECNKIRIDEFRGRMRALLAERIDMRAARKALEAVQAGHWEGFPREAYNGFYSCVACLRHAYRWATNPVVKVAQEEKQLCFPPELDMAWSYIQRRFDITSPSGNNIANIVCNLDQDGQVVYPVNEGMPEDVRKTELAWSRIFYDAEVMSIPIYAAITLAIASFERGDKSLCLAHIESAYTHVRKIMKNLYEKMDEPNIARPIWVRYISGIHSWGLTVETDSPPIEYGGLSGSQILLFMAVDAFLGIDRYHSEEELKMHISRNMRDVAATIRMHSFRNSLSEKLEEDVAIEKAFKRWVKQLRSFRAVHKVRAIRYLSSPAPERVPMTAALSVLPSEKQDMGETDPYASLDGMLAKRMNETI